MIAHAHLALLALCTALAARRRACAVSRALYALLAIDVVRLALAPALAVPGPYAGLRAWLLRLDVMLMAGAWPAVLAALARVVLSRQESDNARDALREGRDRLPHVRDGGHKGDRHALVALPFLAYAAVLAALYPTLRGPPLVAAQGLTRPAVALAAQLALAARPPGALRSDEAIALLLAADALISWAIGAWSCRAPAESWHVSLAASALILAAVAYLVGSAQDRRMDR